MRIFDLIQTSKPEKRCEACAWFQNDPALIERSYPGLTAMSSGFASVRDYDGFCNYNELYLSARDCCANFKKADNESVNV